MKTVKTLLLLFVLSLAAIFGNLKPASAQFTYDETAIRQNTALNSDNRYVVLARGNAPLSSFSLSGWSWWDHVQFTASGGQPLYQGFLSDLASSAFCTQVIYNSDGKITLRLTIANAPASWNQGTIAVYSAYGGYCLLDMDRVIVY